MIEELSYVDYEDADLALSVVSLGWVRDGVNDNEVESIHWIGNIRGGDVASAVVALAWVQDGIDNDLEVSTLEELSYISFDDTGLAMSAVSLGWVQDGIDDVEAEAIAWIGNISGVDVASAVVALGWVQDGIDDLESDALEEISYLSHEPGGRIAHRRYAISGDHRAARRIGHRIVMAACGQRPTAVRGRDDPRAGARRHPPTTWPRLSRPCNGVAETNPGLIPVLLHPANVTVERRTIALPLAGDVVLAIIRTGPGAARSMDLLEHAVRGVERLMGLPLPTNYVGLLYGDAVYGAVAGTNFGTHVAILPGYDVDDGSREAEFAGLPYRPRGGALLTGAATRTGWTRARRTWWPPSSTARGPEGR